MGRKRKVPVADEEKENNEDESTAPLLHGPMYTIMSNVQLNETFHKRYIKEMKQLYTKMDHDAFFFTLIKMIKSAMEADENNEYAHTTLLFCAKFVSSYDTEDTHPLLVDTSKWLLTTISNNPHIRFRLCQFVNMILNALGQEAALDDVICDSISDYMLDRLRDVSPSVRVQAILAMQRLQVPDNPDDIVLRAYQFHLCSDPSPRVRQAVITCMGRNYHTIPYILDRLWDIDEKVRRHTYLHMSSYPVRSYKVSQRLMLLEQGLNDRSDLVRKVVTTVMLKQWIESYQKNLISLVSALKLDSNETEITRFRKITKQTLGEIFRHQSRKDLLKCLPVEEDGKYHRCVPHDKLTIELAFYWQCLTEFLQSEMAEELDMIVPELSTFCDYVDAFCQLQKADMDKFEIMEFQYTLLSLMELLYTFDLGDEIGRGNLQKLLGNLLKNFNLDEKVIEICVRCTENLITDQSVRLQFFLEIIQDICDLSQHNLDHKLKLINELLSNSTDADLTLKLSSLKVKILDLEEQAMNLKARGDYVQSHQIEEEYVNLITPLLAKYSGPEMLNRPKTVKNETILKGLQITFYMVVSSKVNSLHPSVCNLYKDFICRHISSNQIIIRDWALKCGTAYSMLYEALAKDVFDKLYSQFFKNHNIRIWQTAITCIFELLDRYGIDTFTSAEQQIKAKKSARQLYNTLEFLDAEDDTTVSSVDQGVGVIYSMSHFLDTCDDVCILSAIIKGFCRLVLRGHISSSEIIEKLLLRYFNPVTDSEIHQILGVFLENLIERKKHDLLEPPLLPTITSVLSAPYDSPLHDIRPEAIMRFVIDSTRQEQTVTSSCHVHNKIAQSILNEMLSNVSNKDLCKLLAKELVTLDLSVQQNEQMRSEMKEMASKLINSDFDPKTVKYLIDFKDMVDGVYNAIRKSVRNNDSDCEGKSDDETVTKDDEATTTTITNTLDHQTEKSLPNIEETDAETEATLVGDKELPDTTDATTTNATDTTPQVVASNVTNEVSPLAVTTPTTFGPDNVINHRFLRKSLNLSRSQSSDAEVREHDGPSRPKEIRIEMRIDSDKKATSPPRDTATKSPPQRLTRARRNLSYGAKAAEDGRTKNDNADNVVKPTSSRKNDSALKSATEKPTTPVQRNRSTAADRIINNSNKKTNTPSVGANASIATENELNVSDSIPPSPEQNNVQNTSNTRTTTRRLRQRKIVESPAAKNAVAKNQSPTVSKANTITKPTKNTTTTATTPLRNGRKRVLQSPSSSTTSTTLQSVSANESGTKSLSPQRKHQRVEHGHAVAAVVKPTPANDVRESVSEPVQKGSRIPRVHRLQQLRKRAPLERTNSNVSSSSSSEAMFDTKRLRRTASTAVVGSRIPVRSTSTTSIRSTLTATSQKQLQQQQQPSSQNRSKPNVNKPSNHQSSSNSTSSSTEDEIYTAVRARQRQQDALQSQSRSPKRSKRVLDAKMTRMHIPSPNHKAATTSKAMRLRNT